MQPHEFIAPFEQKVVRDACLFARAWQMEEINSAGKAEIVRKRRDDLLKSVMVLEAAQEIADGLPTAEPGSDGSGTGTTINKLKAKQPHKADRAIAEDIAMGR